MSSVKQFFSAKSSPIKPLQKLRVQPLLFSILLLSSSSLFLFLLSFSFMSVIIELFGRKNLAIFPFSLKWLQIPYVRFPKIGKIL